MPLSVSDIKKKLKGYNYRDMTARDVHALMGNFKSLKFRDIKPFVHANGLRENCVSLTGAIPVQIRGVTYNIPITIWVRPTHPYVCPIVYVTPTRDMRIQRSQFVDANGVVSLPYLSEWKVGTSNLTALCQIMCATFADHCPVYSRSAASQQQQSWGQQPVCPPATYTPYSYGYGAQPPYPHYQPKQQYPVTVLKRSQTVDVGVESLTASLERTKFNGSSNADAGEILADLREFCVPYSVSYSGSTLGADTKESVEETPQHVHDKTPRSSGTELKATPGPESTSGNSNIDMKENLTGACEDAADTKESTDETLQQVSGIQQTASEPTDVHAEGRLSDSSTQCQRGTQLLESCTKQIIKGPVLLQFSLTLIKWNDDNGQTQRFYLMEKISHKWRDMGGLLEL